MNLTVNPKPSTPDPMRKKAVIKILKTVDEKIPSVRRRLVDLQEKLKHKLKDVTPDIPDEPLPYFPHEP